MKKLALLYKQLSFNLGLDLVKWLIILILSFIISYLTPEFISKFYISISPYKWWLVFLIFLLFALLIILIIKKQNKNRPNFPKLDFNFQYINTERIHCFSNGNKIIHTNRSTIKALKNGLDSFKSTFYWSGGDFKIQSNIKEHHLNLLPKEGAFQRWELKFDRTLKKGDSITYEIEYTLNNSDVALPYFGSEILSTTDNLNLKVEFGKEKEIKEIRKEVFYNRLGHYPISREIGKIDSQGRFEWNIRKPKLLYYYRIVWIFNI